MIHFLDGPAAGVRLELRRAPILLRAVHVPAIGQWDAFDQPDDVAKPHERVHLYRMVPGTLVQGFVDYRGKDRRRSGPFVNADYRQFAEPVPEEVLRDNARWSTWCELNRERLVSAFTEERKRNG